MPQLVDQHNKGKPRWYVDAARKKHSAKIDYLFLEVGIAEAREIMILIRVKWGHLAERLNQRAFIQWFKVEAW